MWCADQPDCLRVIQDTFLIEHVLNGLPVLPHTNGLWRALGTYCQMAQRKVILIYSLGQLSMWVPTFPKPCQHWLLLYLKFLATCSADSESIWLSSHLSRNQRLPVDPGGQSETHTQVACLWSLCARAFWHCCISPITNLLNLTSNPWIILSSVWLSCQLEKIRDSHHSIRMIHKVINLSLQIFTLCCPAPHDEDGWRVIGINLKSLDGHFIFFYLNTVFS